MGRGGATVYQKCAARGRHGRHHFVNVGLVVVAEAPGEAVNSVPTEAARVCVNECSWR